MSKGNKADGKLPNRPVVREELDTPEKHDLSHQRDERCVPVAHRLIELIASMEDFQVGSHVNEKAGQPSPYLYIIREMLSIMIKQGIKVSEATYIFGLARQAIEAVERGVDETLNQHMNRVSELVYDLPLNDYNEVTIKKLNDVVQRKEKIQEVWKPILLDESLGQDVK
jgi:hypothetical protein